MMTLSDSIKQDIALILEIYHAVRDQARTAPTDAIQGFTSTVFIQAKQDYRTGANRLSEGQGGSTGLPSIPGKDPQPNEATSTKALSSPAPQPSGTSPGNPPTEKQVAWLKSHGYSDQKIAAMSGKEAYWTINKAMKGGR